VLPTTIGKSQYASVGKSQYASVGKSKYASRCHVMSRDGSCCLLPLAEEASKFKEEGPNPRMCSFTRNLECVLVLGT
jgi:hypothetical protein